jgi:hypothetical protein
MSVALLAALAFGVGGAMIALTSPGGRRAAPRRRAPPVPIRRQRAYPSAVNPIEAALIGGFLGALLASGLHVLLTWGQRRQAARESREQRRHDLQMGSLAHRHQLQLAALQDTARLRDARLALLREDAKELTRALFDLERLALLMQWGESANKDEMRRVELAARARFESARAGLTLDPDGGRLMATFASLTREIEQYQSMLQSHRVLVEAKVVQQVVEHADQMEAQHRRVVDGITAAIQETQALLESVAVPVEAPAMETAAISAEIDISSDMTDSAETVRMPSAAEGAAGAAVDRGPDPPPHLSDVATST